MKFLPYCCHFQITSVGATTILNLPFTTIDSFTTEVHIKYKPMDWFLYDRNLRHERVKIQIDHQILIKLRMHKFCYEDPGNKAD